MGLGLETPSQDTVIKRLKATFKSLLPKSEPFIRNTVINALIVAFGSEVADNYKYMEYIFSMLLPHTATGDILEQYAEEYHIIRKQATQSTGLVVFTGVDKSIAPIGTTMQSQSGMKYYTIEEAIIVKRSISVSLEYIAGIVTATTQEQHLLATGLTVTISGAKQKEFNVTTQIIVISDKKFQYLISTHPTENTDSGLFTASSSAVKTKSLGVGSIQNVQQGANLSVIEIIQGIDSVAIAGADGLRHGYDTESYDDLRERYLDIFRKPQAAFSVFYIEAKCKEINGVTRVWVFETTRETEKKIGYVTLYIVCDYDPNIIPSPEFVAMVKTHLVSNENRFVGMSPNNIIVKAPTPKYINFEFATLYPNTQSIQEAIRISLREMFAEEVNVSTNITEHLYTSYISNTIDKYGFKVQSFTLTKPNGDITINNGELGLLNNISF